MQKYIDIKGARTHNLKNIDLKIPKDKLIVMTGVSGSGKSSLAFDTLYAEGQRRYVESLSTYARQFLGSVDKPDVDSIEGLSPAISIDQKTTNKNPRSTIGTVTEIYDHFRLLYSRIGKAYCPNHGIEISSQTITQIVDKVFAEVEGSRIIIYSPIVHAMKGQHAKTLDLIRKDGFTKVRVNGEIRELDEEIILDKNKRHTLDILVDRIKLREESRSRLYNSIETSLKYGDGKVIIVVNDKEQVFSEHLACPYCDFSIPKLEPRLFSFNSPQGACPECKGLGVLQKLDENLLVTDGKKSIRKGAIKYLKNIVDTENMEWQVFETLFNHYNIDIDKAYDDYTDEEKDIIMNGSREPISYTITTRSSNTYHRNQTIEGVSKLIERRYLETKSSMSREYYNSYLKDITCPTCSGRRLSPMALAVKIGGLNLSEFTEFSISDGYKFLNDLELDIMDKKISGVLIQEINNRLQFLINVGLEYLTLDRSSGTLSGGESQRIRLATQIGSKLTGVLYVLDEPSIGLHQRDNERLINTLMEMRDLGNTLVVVEHDEEIMRRCDYLIDIGPRAGVHGGEVVSQGTPDEVMADTKSITGDYLSGRKKISLPKSRRVGNGRQLRIINARENNLKNIDVTIPEGKLTVCTGVSGSGKSTLINEVLSKTLNKHLYRSKAEPGKCDEIIGLDDFDKIIDINQSPIGRTPRSNPATYTGVMDGIRDLFSTTTEAKMRGYNKGRFSFNVKGGRCERCSGDGVIRIEMHFLPDVYVPCEECNGTRYNRETLEVKYKGKNIAEVLAMTIDDASEFFDKIPTISDRLKTLQGVGLGYVKLGQSSTTLSGGEAQRVKLASELYKRITDRSIYTLDEPTTGLHSDDVKKLLDVINYIVDQGATVIIIEHNLDVIKSSDYIIDLGPEGGKNGGTVVFQGTPEEIIKCEASYTGKYLKAVM